MVRVISVHIQSKLLQLTDKDWSHPDLASAKCLHNWMNECLTTPQHEKRSAIGCQNKVNAYTTEIICIQ